MGHIIQLALPVQRPIPYIRDEHWTSPISLCTKRGSYVGKLILRCWPINMPEKTKMC